MAFPQFYKEALQKLTKKDQVINIGLIMNIRTFADGVVIVAEELVS